MADSKMVEYQARAVQNVIALPATREIAIWLRGEPGVEEADLALKVPVGTIAALVLRLRAACADLDCVVADQTAVVQPVRLSDAKAANRVREQAAAVLSLDGLETPVTIPSDDIGRRIVNALEQALALPVGAPSKQRLS